MTTEVSYQPCWNYQDTLPPLLVSMLPRWNSKTLIHVTVKEAQDVPSNQETCKRQSGQREEEGDIFEKEERQPKKGAKATMGVEQCRV